MAVPAVSAISPLGSLGAVGGVDGTGWSRLTSPLAAPPGVGGTQGIDFAEALQKVQGSIDHSDDLSRKLATGELTDIHEYTVAASKAQLGVQLTVAMRNQLLSAFQEVMRMQL
jgi:flagellar hook-basal body complex protein FliE